MVTSVLVVDDDQQIRDLIGALLLDDRVDLEYASTRQSGASLLQTRRFDLAILDAMLSEHPEPDLAALAANEKTPILFMTRDATDARIFGQKNHDFIEKKFIRDRLREQFARMILETRQNASRIKSAVSRKQANAEVLVNAIGAPGSLAEPIWPERSNPSGSQTLVAGDTARVLQAAENHDFVAPVAAEAANSGVTGHLGTLVRHHRSATYEVRFSLEDDRIVVVATRASKPVSLDFNATVQELVSIGRSIFTHSAWLQKQGTLVRKP